MRGINDDELADFVELTRTLPINVRFIEYMPFDGNVWSDTKMVSYADMMPRVMAAFPQGLERLQVSIILLSTADGNVYSTSFDSLACTVKESLFVGFECHIEACESSTVFLGFTALTQDTLGRHALYVFWHS